ncbi:MAG: hypothetical protein ACI86X_001024 [Moritella sp.]|jgi:hypothetical protein
MLKSIIVSVFFCMGLTLTSAAFGHGTESHPPGQKVYIISPLDWQTVPETFTVRFGLAGMGVAPAGIERAKTGHHHLLIDGKELPNMTKPLPATENLKHFGGGQTETQLTLSPGKHTLQLILADHAHVPHKTPLVSKKITVIVK